MSSEASVNACFNAEYLFLIWMYPSLKKKHWCLSERTSASASIPNHLFRHRYFPYQYPLDLPSIRTPSGSTPSGDPRRSNPLRAPPLSSLPSSLTVKTLAKCRRRKTAPRPWCKSIPSERVSSRHPYRSCGVEWSDWGLGRKWTGTLEVCPWPRRQNVHFPFCEGGGSVCGTVVTQDFFAKLCIGPIVGGGGSSSASSFPPPPPLVESPVLHMYSLRQKSFILVRSQYSLPLTPSLSSFVLDIFLNFG